MQYRVQRHGAPDGPGDVQARHCGVLVADGFHGAGLEGPEAAGIDQGVGVVEAVLARPNCEVQLPSSQGGISGKNAKPTSATPVVATEVDRMNV